MPNAATNPQLADCWAKTFPDGPHAGEPALSVRDHCLNVGAVAEILFQFLPATVQSLLPPSAVLLAAIHDIGKLTVGFQWQSVPWREEWHLKGNFSPAQSAGSERRHALVSQVDLEMRAELDKVLKPWAIALGGHHGRFTDSPFQWHEVHENVFAPLRDELLSVLTNAFGSLAGAKLPRDGPVRNARLCLLTGFIIAADWIGSNLDWFPLAGCWPQNQNDATALQTARQAAASAVQQINWQTLRWKNARSFNDLFQLNFAPAALQDAAREHIKEPGFYIIEAPMGTGKTEAALWPAFEMIHTDKAGGIYFALPTQLTANSIHARLGNFSAQAAGEAVQVPLVHSTSWLRSAEALRFAPGDSDDADHWQQARSWFTQRRALLAPLGVGTIDQALMGTLPVKYAALRLYGLAGKVVIFDEVHSYDIYTGTVLDCLIRLLRELRCTVIILSATLTKSRRRALLEIKPGQPLLGDEQSYPAITCQSESGDAAIIHVAIDERMRREVTLEHRVVVSDPLDETLLCELATLAENNACVLVVRNTVKLAQETFNALKSAVREGVEVGLIHSRFPHFQRHGDDSMGLVGREAEWVHLLGRNRDHRPHGCILVGTQVLEQSLDIDADFLVTDLCPIDMLLQRLGRLHRHVALPDRPRPVDCATPRAIVLHPALPDAAEGDPKVWKKALRPHSSIYAPVVLLRTQAAMRNHPAPLCLPEHIRDLIETVYDGDHAGEPIAWAALEQEMLQKKGNMEQLAKAFALEPLTRPTGDDDEQTAATRVIDCPTIPLVLLASEPIAEPGGNLRIQFIHGPDATWAPFQPWSRSLAKAIFLNAVNVPLWWLKECAFSPPDWLAQHVHGGACAAVLNADGNLVILNEKERKLDFRFSREIGVTIRKTPEASSGIEPEDSWF